MDTKYNPAIHHRRSIRLNNYDYSQAGAYFVTICTQQRKCLLGTINHASLELSQYGVIVENVWQQIPDHFPCVSLDAAVVMPNHFHGIVIISNQPIADDKNHNLETSDFKAKKPTLGQVVAYFKYQSTKHANLIRKMAGEKFWQRNYHESIIRSEHSLARVRKYVEKNPEKWQSDRLHPKK
ncbi:transposase [Romeria aff. gracilis LEGE 07310]|uniref:Transposase n=1 Tax=Vasconcelosia minhoensis LEGE 07310 TaxID=915328 RepID=A0A8J7AQY6_9CYAN|nr:transposase [Romeria gracilis]MBE9078969.1 transposase [Romeria aff. gracilis LEGE 07310]